MTRTTGNVALGGYFNDAFYLELLRTAHLSAVQAGVELTDGKSMGLGGRIRSRDGTRVPEESAQLDAKANEFLAQFGLTREATVSLLTNQLGVTQEELAYAWDIPTYTVMRGGERQEPQAPEFFSGNPLSDDPSTGSAYRPNNTVMHRQGRDTAPDAQEIYGRGGDPRRPGVQTQEQDDVYELMSPTGSENLAGLYPQGYGVNYEDDSLVPNTPLGWALEGTVGAMFGPTGRALMRAGGGRLFQMMAKNLDMLPPELLAKFKRLSETFDPKLQPKTPADLHAGPPMPDESVTPIETYGEGQWITADTGYSRWETERGTYMTQEEFIDLSYTEADLVHEGFVSVLGAQHPAPITPFAGTRPDEGIAGTTPGIDYPDPPWRRTPLTGMDRPGPGTPSVRRDLDHLSRDDLRWLPRRLWPESALSWREIPDDLSPFDLSEDALDWLDITHVGGVPRPTEAQRAAHPPGHYPPSIPPHAGRSARELRRSVSELRDTPPSQDDQRWFARERRMDPPDEEGLQVLPDEGLRPGETSEGIWSFPEGMPVEQTILDEWDPLKEMGFGGPAWDDGATSFRIGDIRFSLSVKKRAAWDDYGVDYNPVSGMSTGTPSPQVYIEWKYLPWGQPAHGMARTEHMTRDALRELGRVTDYLVNNGVKVTAIVDSADAGLVNAYRGQGFTVTDTQATGAVVPRVRPEPRPDLKSTSLGEVARRHTPELQRTHNKSAYSDAGYSGYFNVTRDPAKDFHAAAMQGQARPAERLSADHTLTFEGDEWAGNDWAMGKINGFSVDDIAYSYLRNVMDREAAANPDGISTLGDVGNMTGREVNDAYLMFREDRAATGYGHMGVMKASRNKKVSSNPVVPIAGMEDQWAAFQAAAMPQGGSGNSFGSGLTGTAYGVGGLGALSATDFLSPLFSQEPTFKEALGGTAPDLQPVQSMLAWQAQNNDGWWSWIEDYPDHLEWAAKATAATMDALEKTSRSTNSQVLDGLGDGFREQAHSLATQLGEGTVPLVGREDPELLKGVSRDLSQNGYNGHQIFSNDTRKEIENGDAMIVGYRSDEDYQRALGAAGRYGVVIDGNYWRRPSDSSLKPREGEEWTREHLQKMATSGYFGGAK